MSSTTLDPRPEAPTRSRRRRAYLALGVAGALVAVGGGIYLWLNATSGVRRVGTTCAEAATTGAFDADSSAQRGICATMDTLITTWNNGDADGYGAQFTENATYAAFTGTIYQGRDDITAGHASLFAGFLAGSKLDTRVISIDFPAPGVARVLTRGDTYEGDTPPRDLTKVQTYLMVEQDGAWQVAAFHNTQRKPIMERIQFLFDPTSAPALER